MDAVTLWHNPRCSKSRETLKLLEEQRIEVTVVEYLHTPPSAAELDRVLKLLGIEPDALMRKQEAEYKNAGLDQVGLSRAEKIKRMVKNPKVIERPVVITGQDARIGRPPQQILDLF